MDTLSNPKQLEGLLRAYGSHSLAYATLQPRMRYWGDPNVGFVAFRSTLGQTTFLGDPVCPAEEREDFLQQVCSTFPKGLFMQIHRPTADCLKRLGHYITPVGVENDIDTIPFNLAGKKKADLRHYRNKARSGGVVVQEEPDTESVRRALLPVCAAWLPLKSWIAHELEFLARPFQMVPEPGTRLFTGRIDGRIVSFVVLDPIYACNDVIGYTVSILRHLPDAPEGAVDAIVLHAINQFASEGIERLSLGVSPFHHIEALAHEDGRGALPVYWLYRALRRWGDPIYHFRGLSFHKSRYRATESPVYTAAPGPISLWPLYASARACRML